MTHNWVRMTPDSRIPPNAVDGGLDSDDCPTYVGRACHEGCTFPARVNSSNHCAYISWGGSQIKRTEYEILVGENYKFVKYSSDVIPLSAVRAGNTADGDPLWVGRGMLDGIQIVGKIHPIHQCLFVAFEEEEHRLNSYEVLVHKPKQSTSLNLDNVLPNGALNELLSREPSSQSHIWVGSSWGKVPPNAVVGGTDSDGSTIYVGRAYHEGGILPAKVIPRKDVAYVSCDGVDIFKENFEVLVGYGYSWVKGMHSGNNIPPGAVSTGKTRDGTPVYVGRGPYLGSLTPGKVHPGEYFVYIAFFGKEHKISNSYEMLVRTVDNVANDSSQSHKWVCSALDDIPSNAVIAGHDGDDARSTIYVGRAYHDGETLPAKVIPSRWMVYISRNGLDILIRHKFDVLVGDGYSWVKGTHCGDNIPPGAVSTGETKDGEQVYVGRGPYYDSLTPGKVFRGQYCVFIAYYHKEHKIDTYEILVKNYNLEN